MVLLQSLTGARPGEILSMRAGEIQRSLCGPWTYHPGSHKTEHHGTTRTIFLGPQAQAVLAPWLDGLSDVDHVFAATRKQATDLPGKPFDKDTYRQLIQRVCQRHSIPDWKPNQLRHLHATRIREQFGLEAAQVVLGHTKADTTEIYAERNLQLAARVQLAIG
jgi:integrase